LGEMEERFALGIQASCDIVLINEVTSYTSETFNPL
jgi:hypothetical protein